MESAGELWIGLLLFAVAVVAGWVDAIGGGGGLLYVPALLLTEQSRLAVFFSSSPATRSGLSAWSWGGGR